MGAVSVRGIEDYGGWPWAIHADVLSEPERRKFGKR